MGTAAASWVHIGSGVDNAITLQNVGGSRLLCLRDGRGEDIYGSGAVVGRGASAVGKTSVVALAAAVLAAASVLAAVALASIIGRAGLANSAAAWSRLGRLAVRDTSGDLATVA